MKNRECFYNKELTLVDYKRSAKSVVFILEDTEGSRFEMFGCDFAEWIMGEKFYAEVIRETKRGVAKGWRAV